MKNNSSIINDVYLPTNNYFIDLDHYQ